MSADVRLTRWLLYAAAAWALFIAYGSLLPFEFRARSVDRILPIILAGDGEVGYRSLTDRIVNLLLGVPLGFALFGGSARGRLPGNLWAAILTLVASGLLAAAVEFGQIFLPTRSASFADIIAQCIGAAVGIFLWSLLGRPVMRAFRISATVTPIEPTYTKNTVTAARVTIVVYALMLLAVNGWFTATWLNLDQAAGTFHEFRLAPFYNYYSASIFRSLYSAVSTVGEYTVLALLLWYASNPPRQAARSGTLCGLTALVVESGKFFIANRSPDSTNIFLAVLSAGLVATLWPRVYGILQHGTNDQVIGEDREPTAVVPVAQVPRFRLIVFRTTAIIVFAMAVTGVLNYPLAPLWLLTAVCLYAMELFYYPTLWLIILPALLPSLDLAPWSGRFFLDEFDFFVLSTIGVGLWLSAARTPILRVPGVLKILLFALGFSACISVMIGLLPLQPLDANAFASYFSRYSALRAAKGFALVLGLIPLVLYNLSDRVEVARRLGVGMVAGLVTVIAASLWERAMFPGLFDFTSDFRTSALFSTMNTGDGPIETYLVAALPLVFIWLAERRSLGSALAAIVGFVLGTYALFVTFSRGGYFAFIAMLAVLFAGNVLSRNAYFQAGKRLHLPLLVSLLVGSMAVLFVFETSFSRSRLAQSGADWGVRLDHWRGVISLMDADWRTTFFGMGLGRYPDTDRRKSWAVKMPSYYTYLKEGENQFLRLSAGAPAYLEQIVDVAPGEKYRIALDLRGVTGPGTLNVMACERTFFRSYHCRDSGVWSSAAGAGWSKREAVIDSGPVGSGNWPLRRTVKLILENTSRDTAVDVDNVKLTNGAGAEILNNGDFAHGNDHWFYTASDHLRWHIKNIWVQVYFEQGIFGVAIFAIFVFAIIVCLTMAALRGDFVYTALLAGFVGFLCVGLFASPLDAPRLNFLFYLLGVVGILGALTPAMCHASIMPGVKPTVSISPAPSGDKIAAEIRDVPAPSQSIWDPGRLSVLIVQILGGLCAFVAGAWLVLHLPFVPYNVRALLHPVHPFLSLVVFGMFLYWSLGFPVVIGYVVTMSARLAWSYPLLLTLHSVVAWFLITYGVNFDRILKIVGSPVLKWHWYWEPAGRFIALFSVFSLLMTGAALLVVGIVYRRRGTTSLIAWSMTSALLAPLLYWIVVTQAATDNLVELMAGGGTPVAAVYLSFFLFFLVGGGTSVAAIIHSSIRRRCSLAVLVLLLSLPLAYIAFALGSEQGLEKYGKVFSALQFLLSPDRDHYVSGLGLWLRYIVIHCAVTGAVIVVQYPLFSWLFRKVLRSRN